MPCTPGRVRRSAPDRRNDRDSYLTPRCLLPTPVKAITFDLWDTLVIDDSDEPKRAARGLPPKSQARPRAVHHALSRHHDVSFETVDLAHRTTTAAFNAVWHDLHVTWTVPERLSVMLGGLGLTLPHADLAEVARTLEQMEVEIPPDPIAGIDTYAQGVQGAMTRHFGNRLPCTVVEPGRYIVGVSCSGRCLCAGC